MKHLDEHGWKTDYISVRRKQNLLAHAYEDIRRPVLYFFQTIGYFEVVGAGASPRRFCKI